MVGIDASLGTDGSLHAKVRYAMRGDTNCYCASHFTKLRGEVERSRATIGAFRRFRGKITNVSASDPYATKDPFTVEYEITQAKFVDWSKKPVRIPALLPQLGLPDPPGKTGSDAVTHAIDLGTPLDVETQLALHLPAGTVVRTPTGTSVERDYATFASKYEVSDGVVTASRHLNFYYEKFLLTAQRTTIRLSMRCKEMKGSGLRSSEKVRRPSTRNSKLRARRTKLRQEPKKIRELHNSREERDLRRYLIDIISFSFVALRSSIFFVSACDSFSNSSSRVSSRLR